MALGQAHGGVALQGDESCGCRVLGHMVVAGHAALGWATSQEEGAVWASSCRCLPSWVETGPRNLGRPPSACQAAKYDTAGLSGLEGRFIGKCLRAEPAVGRRSVWGSWECMTCCVNGGLGQYG